MTIRTAAMPSALGRTSAAMSVSMPICRKKIGTNTDASADMSRATRSCPGERPSAVPATKAPIMGAKCAASAALAKPKVMPKATTDAAAGELARFNTVPMILGSAVKPTKPLIARKENANPVVEAMVPIPIDPFSTTRETTVRIMRPSTSSATAAPKTMRASLVDNARRSPNTRAVMPTLVAVSVAPTNSAVRASSPMAMPPKMPKPMGKTTPRIATLSAARPTVRSSLRSISIPT